jgi:3-hydroxyacyl-CoA dehydrogenase
MVAMGATGRAAGGGFYARDGSQRLAIDLATLEYRPAARPPRLPPTPRELVEMGGPLGDYAATVLGRTLAYAAAMVPDVTDRPELIDLAMQRGYGWERGPFALIDELDPGRLAGRAIRVPIAGGGARDHRERIAGNDSASLWDAGDGVACLELHSKANAIDAAMLEMIARAAGAAGDGYRAVVVYSESAHFSVGANLAHVLALANVAAWERLDAFGAAGRAAFGALKFARLPVVGAVSGRALGGGCELLLHCDAVQAHTDTYMGLVEVNAGLVPGWGGCRELLLRAARAAPANGPMPAARMAFETIATARVSTSAQEARELGFLRPGDRITPNRDRLLADARARALELADGYAPPEPGTLTVAGRSGRATLALSARQLARRDGAVTEYDLHLADVLAGVLTGGDADLTEPVPESAISTLEAAAVADLVRREQTLARMTHVLETGRPLRN